MVLWSLNMLKISLQRQSNIQPDINIKISHWDAALIDIERRCSKNMFNKWSLEIINKYCLKSIDFIDRDLISS